jgi:hypothetical protein
MTGSQLNTSCPAISNANKLNLTGYNVQDLTGLEYFGGIDTLIVNSSSLNIIPSFPPSLRYISIGQGIFNQIPQLPFLLDNLAIYNSDLSELPSIPNSVTKLYLPNNNLDSLPILPGGLTRLDVSYNQLTFIDLYNNTELDFLNVLENQLTELDIYHNYKLNSLYADYLLPNYSDLQTFLVLNRLDTTLNEKEEATQLLLEDMVSLIKWILGLLVFLIIAKIISKFQGNPSN